MIEPVLILDSRERWRPVGVEESLDAVSAVVPHGWPVSADPGSRLDLPRNMKQPDLPPVGYHRVATGGGLYWRQYWTWWLYNPKQYAGFGAHEGDWEMVQIGCTDEAGDHPVLMTCSQHSAGEKREYWRVSLTGAKRPRVFVARDSHANYFSQTRDVTDIADGNGTVLTNIEWRPFGSWAEWPGQWGNSDNSPGPLSTRRAWKAPHAWHGQARG